MIKILNKLYNFLFPPTLDEMWEKYEKNSVVRYVRLFNEIEFAYNSFGKRLYMKGLFCRQDELEPYTRTLKEIDDLILKS
jgi:hypothetical protein